MEVCFCPNLDCLDVLLLSLTGAGGVAGGVAAGVTAGVGMVGCAGPGVGGRREMVFDDTLLTDRTLCLQCLSIIFSIKNTNNKRRRKNVHVLPHR